MASTHILGFAEISESAQGAASCQTAAPAALGSPATWSCLTTLLVEKESVQQNKCPAHKHEASVQSVIPGSTSRLEQELRLSTHSGMIPIYTGGYYLGSTSTLGVTEDFMSIVESDLSLYVHVDVLFELYIQVSELLRHPHKPCQSVLWTILKKKMVVLQTQKISGNICLLPIVNQSTLHIIQCFLKDQSNYVTHILNFTFTLYVKQKKLLLKPSLTSQKSIQSCTTLM